jgi:predicted GIY-YIG superfamily endonuclease
VESQPDRSTAMKREHVIKKMSRKGKVRLISLNPNVLFQDGSTLD